VPIVTIDGHPISVEPDTLIIQAADRAGIEIPRFCYHPDLRPEGNCRMCLVHIKGFANLSPACTTPVTDDMVVNTAHQHDQVRQATKGVLEFLLINHPLDCPVCDQAGECSLQDFYLHPDYGLHPSDVDPPEKVRKRKALNLGPIYLDSERCVMCSRCVRFSNEVSGTGELQFVHRGNHVEIEAFEDRALRDPYAGNLADVCPVGALTSRDFRFKRRVWFLRHANSICAGCSTGCNVRIDYAENAIDRVVPRRNPAVNKSWMCDEGRLSYHNLQDLPRLESPLQRTEAGLQPVSWEEAMLLGQEGMRGPYGRVSAVVASAMATNETLWILRQCANSLPTPTEIDFRLQSINPDINAREDHLLRRLDKAPNSRGAMLLGAGAGRGIEAMAQSAEEGKVGVVVILHYPPLVGQDDNARLAAFQRLIRGAAFSVVLTNTVSGWWNGADVVLPVASWSEEEGTFTNFAGITQLTEAALTPPGEARPAWKALRDLLPVGSLSPRLATVEQIFDRGVAVISAFEGLHYATLASREATVYPPEGRKSYGQEGFAGR